LSKQTRAPQIENLSFEDAFAQLEDIVHKLEGGSLSLDESLALFERGQRLAAHCNAMLDQAELKVQQLAAGPDGADKLSPFADDETR
jgi:exodeoxyribonuclease VII small subunit